MTALSKLSMKLRHFTKKTHNFNIIWACAILNLNFIIRLLSIGGNVLNLTQLDILLHIATLLSYSICTNFTKKQSMSVLKRSCTVLLKQHITLATGIGPSLFSNEEICQRQLKRLRSLYRKDLEALMTQTIGLCGV